MYNQLLNLNIDNNLNLNNLITRRAVIYTNLICSYNCIFCYYKNKKKHNKIINNIYEKLIAYKYYGILDIDFSGGEPAQDINFLNYIKFAKILKYRRIAVITNGYFFSNIDYLKECIKSGLNEIVFSIHGYNDEIHDKITQIKNSFKNIIQSIDNAKKLNLLIRFNTTVCEYNIDSLIMHTNLINYYQPVCQNYLSLNYYDDNENYDLRLDYDCLTDNIKLSIDKINKNNINYITVRYYPYCYFRNYEQYVFNKYQHIYDPFDWSVELIDLNNIDYNIINNNQYYGYNSYNKANSVRKKYYYKDKNCLNCKYAYICDGIQIELKNKIKLKPINGEYIKDPTYFIKDYINISKYNNLINNYN